MRFANRAARLRIIVQLDAQAAKRDSKKTGSVRAIAMATHERIEDVLLLDLG